MSALLSYLPTAAQAGLLPFLLVLAAKATAILAGAALAAWLLRRAAASVRHLVWCCAIGAMLLLPALSLSLPELALGVLPAALRESAAPPAAAAADPGPTWSAPAPGPVPGAAKEAPAAFDRLPEASVPAPIPVAGWLLLAWAAGAILVLLRLVVGQAGVRRLRAEGEPVEASLRWLATEMSARLQLHRTVEMLHSQDASMPMTWGVFQPTILLPAEAAGWPDTRRRAVLLHELAHVKRLDCLTQTLAVLCCGLYWFHPGVWWAARRMLVEREAACDDAVIAAGIRPSDYAAQLLEVARGYRRTGFSQMAAIAMARPSQLEGRLLAVLDAARDRAAPSRRAGAIAFASALLALIPLSALRPAAQAAPPGETRIIGQDADTVPRPRPAIAAWASRSETAATAATEARTAAAPFKVKIAIAPEFAHEAAMMAAPHPSPAPRPRAAVAAHRADPRHPADPRAVAALVAATGDSDAEVRRAAVGGLGEMADTQAVPALIQALRDADAGVRAMAAHALGELEACRAVDPLIAALGDSNADVTRSVAWALAEIGDPRAAVALAAALPAARGADARRAIIYALGELDLSAAPQPLLDAVRDADPDTRKAAIHALAEIGDARALPAVRQGLKDPDAGVRKAAIFAVFEFDDPQSLDLLIELLEDADPQVRRQAAMAIGSRG